MANEEHLRLLQQGIVQWNTWREQHQEIQPDLSLTNLNLADLSRANLSSANLSGSKLYDADLRGAVLNDTNLNDADLSRARVSQTVFATLDLRNTKGLVEIRHDGPSSVTLNT